MAQLRSRLRIKSLDRAPLIYGWRRAGAGASVSGAVFRLGAGRPRSSSDPRTTRQAVAYARRHHLL